jgi:beta-mannosidase
LRRVYAERLLTVQPRDGVPALVAVNDATTPWRAQLDVRRASFAGVAAAKATLSVEVPALSAVTVRLPADVATPDNPAVELIMIDGAAARAVWWFGEDVDLAYPRAAADVAVRPGDGGVAVDVTARTLLRDLTLFPDRLDPAATVDDMLVTLLPGESVTFHVAGGAALHDVAAETWATVPVLRTANDLVAP